MASSLRRNHFVGKALGIFGLQFSAFASFQAVLIPKCICVYTVGCAVRMPVGRAVANRVAYSLRPRKNIAPKIISSSVLLWASSVFTSKFQAVKNPSANTHLSIHVDTSPRKYEDVKNGMLPTLSYPSFGGYGEKQTVIWEQ